MIYNLMNKVDPKIFAILFFYSNISAPMSYRERDWQQSSAYVYILCMDIKKGRNLFPALSIKSFLS